MQQLLHNMQKRAMNPIIKKLDSQDTEIEQMKDSAEMFRVVYLMR